jgi:hypothetical protein
MAPRIEGPLRVAGPAILDAHDQPVRFLSINVGSMGRGQGLPGEHGLFAAGCRGWVEPEKEDLDNIAAWGFNSVRLNLSWANLEPFPPKVGPSGLPQHHYDETYMRALDATISGFARRGVAVILAMIQAQWSPAFHDVPTPFGIACQGKGMPAWLYPNATLQTLPLARRAFFLNEDDVQAGYVAAWREVASRYAANPMVVGADMFNEPYTLGAFPPGDLHLDQLYAKVGSAIRAADPDILLIFQDSNFHGPGTLALAGPPALSNEGYECHLYEHDWRPQGLSRAQVYVQRAEQWNVPLWLGEFDAFFYVSRLPPDPNWMVDTRDMLSFLRERGVGWALWQYSRGGLLTPQGDPKPGLLTVLQGGF